MNAAIMRKPAQEEREHADLVEIDRHGDDRVGEEAEEQQDRSEAQAFVIALEQLVSDKDTPPAPEGTATTRAAPRCVCRRSKTAPQSAELANWVATGRKVCQRGGFSSGPRVVCELMLCRTRIVTAATARPEQEDQLRVRQVDAPEHGIVGHESAHHSDGGKLALVTRDPGEVAMHELRFAPNLWPIQGG